MGSNSICSDACVCSTKQWWYSMSALVILVLAWLCGCELGRSLTQVMEPEASQLDRLARGVVICLIAYCIYELWKLPLWGVA